MFHTPQFSWGVNKCECTLSAIVCIGNEFGTLKLMVHSKLKIMVVTSPVQSPESRFCSYPMRYEKKVEYGGPVVHSFQSVAPFPFSVCSSVSILSL